MESFPSSLLGFMRVPSLRALVFIQKTYNCTIIMFLPCVSLLVSCHVVHAHSTDKEPTTEEPQTVEMVISTDLVSSIQPTMSVETTVLVSSSSCIQPTMSVETTVLVSSNSSIQPTTSVETTVLVSSNSSIQPTTSVGTTVLVSSNSSIQPTKRDGAVTTTETVPVSSSTTQPTNNSPSDGATTTTVIIVVAVMIILVVIVVGVGILVILFTAKKRKQQLVVNKFQNIATENEDIEMKLKQERKSEEEASSNANQPPYTEIQTNEPPNIPKKSEELTEYFNQNSTFAGDSSEIEREPANEKHALPAKHPRHVSLSDPMSEEKEPSPMYQDIGQHSDPTSTTNVVQENDIYSEPDTTNSHTVDPDSRTYETVYSEPIEPSLFTDAAETPSDCEDFQPYAPIYTIPTDLPKSEEVLLKVFGSNVREICDLGMGQFGKVILAETVGLSANDLRLSESDDDKSKSTLVAVKKLKSDAPNATKEAFEKEVNFMSRLTDRNVIRILGVCYEDTPFIMMEYMEKGDLNHYLQKFKTLSTTDSETQGHITTGTLVHMTTQIASAMKYLASHNFVHRDLATRNCLVGPNYLVKISDFGMSRSLYDSHYYRIHGRFALPVRWMSYECFYGKFSQKSDVWAFGVTMWEIFTLAKVQPYNDISDRQVVEDALRGKNRTLLAKPNICPLKVYKIMLKCWAHNSNERATFEKLLQLLTSIPTDQ